MSSAFGAAISSVAIGVAGASIVHAFFFAAWALLRIFGAAVGCSATLAGSDAAAPCRLSGESPDAAETAGAVLAVGGCCDSCSEGDVDGALRLTATPRDAGGRFTAATPSLTPEASALTVNGDGVDVLYTCRTLALRDRMPKSRAAGRR